MKTILLLLMSSVAFGQFNAELSGGLTSSLKPTAKVGVGYGNFKVAVGYPLQATATAGVSLGNFIAYGGVGYEQRITPVAGIMLLYYNALAFDLSGTLESIRLCIGWRFISKLKK